jgi:hypothetical protein
MNLRRFIANPAPEGHRLVGALASLSNKVARQLNERPRETLHFETPAERFNACVGRPVEPAAQKRTFGLAFSTSALCHKPNYRSSADAPDYRSVKAKHRKEKIGQ